MFTKIRRMLAARKALRAIESAMKKEAKMGKHWWESKQFWGVAIKTGAGLLTTFGLLKHSIDDAHLSQFADHIPVVLTGIGTVVGQILETWGKRKHAESLVGAK